MSGRLESVISGAKEIVSAGGSGESAIFAGILTMRYGDEVGKFGVKLYRFFRQVDDAADSMELSMAQKQEMFKELLEVSQGRGEAKSMVGKQLEELMQDPLCSGKMQEYCIWGLVGMKSSLETFEPGQPSQDKIDAIRVDTVLPYWHMMAKLLFDKDADRQAEGYSQLVELARLSGKNADVDDWEADREVGMMKFSQEELPVGTSDMGSWMKTNKLETFRQAVDVVLGMGSVLPLTFIETMVLVCATMVKMGKRTFLGNNHQGVGQVVDQTQVVV